MCLISCICTNQINHPELDDVKREITCWQRDLTTKAEESDAWCQQVISGLARSNEECFVFPRAFMCSNNLVIIITICNSLLLGPLIMGLATHNSPGPEGHVPH